MKIDNIKIENMRSYGKQSIPLGNEITVITGPNGSGKSSLLESMFIGLYGSKAIVANDQKISDFISTGSTNGSCEVQFSHLGHDYSITREYAVNSQNGNASNKKSVLEVDGSFIAEQSRNTYDEICNILNMDEDSFRNCVYIRQGEIDTLIRAPPSVRQNMIDDLLQIGKLENYHNRAKSALTSINRLIRDTDSTIKSKTSELNGITNINPIQQLKILGKQETELMKKRQEISDKKKQIDNRITQKSNQISSYEDDIKEKNEIDRKIESNKTEKEKLNSEINQFDSQINELNEQISHLQTQISELCQQIDIRNVTIDDIDTIIESFENSVSRAYETIMSTQSDIKSIDHEIKNKEDQNTKLENDITEIRQSNTDTRAKIDEYKTKINSKEFKIKGINDHILELLNDSSAQSIDEMKEITEQEGKLKEQSLEKFNDIKSREKTLLSQYEAHEIQYNDICKQIDDETKRQSTIVSKLNNAKNTQSEVSHEMDTIEKTINETKSNIKELLENNNLDSGIEITSESLKGIQKSVMNKHIDTKSEETRIGNSIETLEQQKKKEQDLLNQGICPTCNQEINSEHFHNDINQIDENINKLKTELSGIRELLSSIKKQNDTIQKAIELNESIDKQQSTLDKLQIKIDTAKDTINDLESNQSDLTEHITTLEDRKSNLYESMTQVNNQITEIRSDIQKHESEYKTHKDMYDKYNNLVDSLTTNKSQKDVLKSEITGINETINELEPRIKENMDKISNIENQVSENKTSINDLTQKKGELETRKAQEDKTYADEKQKESTAKTIKSNLQTIESNKTKIKSMNEQIVNKRSMIDVYKKQDKEYDERIHVINEKIKGIDINNLKNTLTQFENASISCQNQIDDIDNENNQLQQKIGNMQTNRDRMKTLSNELSVLNNKKDHLLTISEDTEILDTVYTQTRTEIRAKNINTLNKYINEMFGLMSIDSAYSHVILDNEYNIQVFKKDGIPLDPKHLSGGERAILNIVFRCAIYRLLAHGFSSASNATLPPIIMDEPTTYLDREHVKQLIQLLDSMKSLGVDQILVVTHDDTLIDAADTVYRVEKDSVTNESKIRRTAEAKLSLAV